MGLSEKYFKNITAVLLTLIGIPGNCMIFYIFTRENFRKVPMFRYFIASTVFETINLILYWALISDSINKNSLLCKISQYISYVVSLNISWIGVLIAIDRYLSIIYLFKFQNIKMFL